MKKVMSFLNLFAMLAISSLLMTSCMICDDYEAAPEVAPACAPAPAPAVVQEGVCPQVVTSGGNVTVTRAIPTGDQADSIVLIEKTAPQEVSVDSPFDYTVKVTNLTDCPLDDVIVTETLADGFIVDGTSPQAVMTANKLKWELGRLAPNASKVLTIRGLVKGTQTYTNCTAVTYTTPTCITVNAVKPSLTLVKNATERTLVCDMIKITYFVGNDGSGATTNVVINDTLADGLTVNGSKNVSIKVGTLAPGETKEFSVDAKAAKTGTFKSAATATADAGLKVSADAGTVVVQPILTIAKTAIAKLFVGRQISYKITVGNKGTAAAKNLVVQDLLPAGVEVVSTKPTATVEGQTLGWTVASLEPGKAAVMEVVVKAVTQGRKVNKATAKAICAAEVEDVATTDVMGIPAILLEVIDLDDPIEVGGEEVYEITATNQGSAPGTNIKIVCTLEDTQQGLSANGATEGKMEGKKLTFAPLASLAPKAKAVWRVKVKALAAGDVRFSVSMTSDQLKREVAETESTNQY